LPLWQLNASNHNFGLIGAGIIEERRQRLQEALRYYYEAVPLLDQSEDHALKGAFHNEFALLFTRLGTEENRRDYLDKALIDHRGTWQQDERQKV